MFKKVKNMMLKEKLLGLISISVIGFIVFNIISFNTLNVVKVDGILYKGIIENKNLVADILPPPQFIIESYLNVLQILHERDESKLKVLIQNSGLLKNEYENRHQYWKNTLAPGLLRDFMVVRSYRFAQRFFELRDKEFIPAILKGDFERADEVAHGELKQAYEEHRILINQVVKLADQKTTSDEQSALLLIRERTIIQIVLGFGVSLLVIALGFILARMITTPLNEIATAANKIAQKSNLNVELTGIDRTDELGILARAFKSMMNQLNHLFAGLKQEITERKRAEEEVRMLNQDLEKRVAKRTEELEISNKELEAFAYSVSHDLRAPLRHIEGFMELLKQDIELNMDKQSEHYMVTISESAKKMGELIDCLLSFSRMGRREILKNRLDMNLLINEVIKEFEPEMKGRVIKWKVSFIPQLTGDITLIKSVLSNLISNALKFTGGRSCAEIEIGCNEKEDETIVYIRDNGVGFDMQYASHLFGVFQRLHHVDEFEGTGIGLATVQRIITKHGGKAWAESEIDQGATFYFSIPK